MTATDDGMRCPEPPDSPAESDDDPPAFEGPLSTGASLLELVQSGIRWHGADLEECLDIVYATRSVWYLTAPEAPDDGGHPPFNKMTRTPT